MPSGHWDMELRQNRQVWLVALVALVFAGGVAVSLFVGHQSRVQAYAVWQARAVVDAERLTEAANAELMHSRKNLRAFGAVFRGTPFVGEETFRETARTVRGWDVYGSFVATAYALMVRRPDRAGVQKRLRQSFHVIGAPEEPAPDRFLSFIVDISTQSRNGLLLRGGDLATHPELWSAAVTATRLPKDVVMSRVFELPNGHHGVSMAFAAPNGEWQGVLVAIFDVTNFVRRLVEIYAPPGLNLRLAQSDARNNGDRRLQPLIGELDPPAKAMETITFRVAHGAARWHLSWDVTEEYLGGPDLGLARAIAIGGSFFSLLLAALMGVLVLQNVRIGRIVDQRTSELAKARDEAETASRTKSAFLAAMSHELRTPLNAIIGFSELIRSQAYGDLGSRKYGEYARDITDSAGHLLSLINDILDISKAEAGKLQLRESAVDVRRVVNSTARLVQERAKQSRVQLTTEVSEAMPPLYCDERKLKQIILNLLSNAIKFTPADGKVFLDATLNDRGEFELRVRDTGIGMSPEDIPKALEAFGQIDHSLSREYQGTGLGLPLVKVLTELHGGDIAIWSEPGAGTEIIVHLPGERLRPDMAA